MRLLAMYLRAKSTMIWNNWTLLLNNAPLIITYTCIRITQMIYVLFWCKWTSLFAHNFDIFQFCWAPHSRLNLFVSLQWEINFCEWNAKQWIRNSSEIKENEKKTDSLTQTHKHTQTRTRYNLAQDFEFFT